MEFDETKGYQDENENLEDVRGIQLSNAMKNMDVDELRPRQVNGEEDDCRISGTPRGRVNRPVKIQLKPKSNSPAALPLCECGTVAPAGEISS